MRPEHTEQWKRFRRRFLQEVGRTGREQRWTVVEEEIGGQLWENPPALNCCWGCSSLLLSVSMSSPSSSKSYSPCVHFQEGRSRWIGITATWPPLEGLSQPFPPVKNLAFYFVVELEPRIFSIIEPMDWRLQSQLQQPPVRFSYPTCEFLKMCGNDDY